MSPSQEQPAGPLDVPRQVVGWVAAVVREITYAPSTLSGARRLLDDVSALGGQLDRVVGAVERTTGPLSGSLEDVAEALNEIRERLEHLDDVIGHLRDTLVAVIGAVPGARRALDRLPPPTPRSAGDRADTMPHAPTRP